MGVYIGYIRFLFLSRVERNITIFVVDFLVRAIYNVPEVNYEPKR